MLKLKDISDVEKIYNESDFYIKIKIIFGHRYGNDEICYWSTLGPKGSLIEIGIKKACGAIYEITVVSAPTIHNQNAPEIKKYGITKTGLPLLETNAWQKDSDSIKYDLEHFTERYYIREKMDFEIYAGKENTTLLFSTNDIVLHVVNHTVIFGFDDNNHLCSIQLNDMVLNNEGFLENA